MVSLPTSSDDTEPSVDLVEAERAFVRDMEYALSCSDRKGPSERGYLRELAMKAQTELQASREEYARLSDAYATLREQYAEAVDVAAYLSDCDVNNHVELTNLAAENHALKKRLRLQLVLTAAATILMAFLAPVILHFLS